MDHITVHYNSQVAIKQIQQVKKEIQTVNKKQLHFIMFQEAKMAIEEWNHQELETGTQCSFKANQF